jgi:hypothetical protein
LAVQYFVGLATGNPSMWMRTLGTSANSTWKLIVSGADVMPTTYTPNLTAATTNPTGQTTTGRYSVTAGVCSFTFSATIGTGTGSGAYSISVPVPVGANWLAGYGGSGAIAGIGNGSLQQGSNRVQGQWGILSGSLRLYVPTAFNTVSAVTSVLPFALASGSVMYGEVQFGTT